jgi:hypothetical protein
MFADTSATLDDTPGPIPRFAGDQNPSIVFVCKLPVRSCFPWARHCERASLCYFTGQRLSISFRISSAHLSPSAIALTVAGTLAPPSYWASFLAARIDAAIRSTRLRPSSTHEAYHIRLLFAFKPMVRSFAQTSWRESTTGEFRAVQKPPPAMLRAICPRWDMLVCGRFHSRGR